jgi:hypothetical protein
MKQKITVTINFDSDVENPSQPEYGGNGQWTHISFVCKHCDYQDPDNFLTLKYKDGRLIDLKGNTPGLCSKLEAGTAFLLSYYEHGNRIWSLRGEETQDCFDTSGILLWEHPPCDLGAETYEGRQHDARLFLESYNDWCNGYGYSYAIKYPNYKTYNCVWYAHLKSEMCDSIEQEIRDYLVAYSLTKEDVKLKIKGDAADYMEIIL